MDSLFAANILGELLGAIEKALGTVLSVIYSVVHNYAIAIILLTIAVRALLIPLTVKQIRSMGAMQTIQPELKKVQQKYKQLQQKAKDRMEVQQLRMQMNQEMQVLYKAHGVNPLGGCLPLLGQMPVYIAMFAIMRAAIFVTPAPIAVTNAVPTPTPSVTASASASPSASASASVSPTGSPNNAPFATADRKSIICRPIAADGTFLEPSNTGSTPTRIKCEDVKTGTLTGPDTFTISGLVERGNGKAVAAEGKDAAPWITQCRPTGVEDKPFLCQSAVGTGHLPRDSKLFADVTRGKASVFGMHPGCSASQVSSKVRVKECNASGTGGTAQAIPYWLLVALIVATQYIQGKQMAARASGPQAQQQQMMTRIMPVFLGFISLQLPAGANLYFFVQNLWMIGQQHLLLSKQQPVAAGAKPTGKALPPAEKPKDEPKPAAQNKPQQGSKKRKRKKR